MPDFLSPAWIAALDRAAAADEALAAATADVELVIEQRVTRDDGPATTYHVVLDHGTASVRPGPAPEPTVRFSQDAATARAIAAGERSAQRAFMAGDLQVGGDVRVLLDHAPLFAALGDTFAAVRADTFPAAAGDDPGAAATAGA